MNQTFNTFFKLNESTVIGKADDFSVNARCNRIFFNRGNPRILCQLFHTQGDAFFFNIQIQNLDGNFISYFKEFGWMLDPAPRNVRNVKQTVNAA